MKILIIIPAYNEEENIERVVNNLKNNYSDYDYLVVNDCSTDSTLKLLNSLDASYVSLPVNMGIGGGVQTGYIYALEHDYDIAIQMDGDGQHNPEYIEKLIQPLIKGETDTAIGSRFIENEGFQSSFMRRVGINFLSSLIHLMCGVKVLDVTSGFRAVNRKCIEMFAKEYAQDYPEPEAIVYSALQGARIQEVPVIMNERVGGVSSINGLKSIYYMIKVSMAVIIKRMTMRKKVAR